MGAYVYIAGPYSKGDQALNVRAAIEAATEIVDLGMIPYVPHLTHFWHMVAPRSYQFWLWFDKKWLAKCDYLLRLPGESSGSDGEVELAKALDIPVAYTVEELITLVREGEGKKE